MQGIAINLEDILRGAAKAAGNTEPAAPARPDDITARLVADAAKDWYARCPFKEGELVKPNGRHAWSASLGVCCVVRVFDVDEELPATEYGCAVADYDMLVLAAADTGKVHCLRAHSRGFERYTGAVA